MIARIIIPIVIATLFGAFYFDRQHWRKRSIWLRLLCWLLPLAAIVFTVVMASDTDYFPDDSMVLNTYLGVLCIFIVPLALIALSGAIGLCLKRRKTGERIGWTMSLGVVAAYCYGTIIGFGELQVRHLELSFSDLPREFDGYKMVQFSDVHAGTYTGTRVKILQRAVDSINAQHADAVVFTGDLQNKKAVEIAPLKQLLQSIKAPDGVYSVLGNHDYTEYVGTEDPYEQVELMAQTVNMEKELGWKLLTNSRQRLRRGSATLVIAGMENDGEGRFPQHGDITSTLYGVARNEFVVMLEHDPSSWRRKILPHCHAQLTLSGHTHGGQLSIFGWSLARLRYREYSGLYQAGERKLYVSNGLGGVVPFRLGMPAEIVVITLRKK